MSDDKKGFIKLDRAMMEWEWYDHVPTKVLWLHLLLKANWKSSDYRGHKIPAGSMVTGVNKLAEQTGLTVQQVRTSINNLKQKQITIKTTNKFSIISIVKWDKYQGSKNKTTNKTETDDSDSLTPPTTSKELNNQEYILLTTGASVEAVNAFMEHRKNHYKKPKNTEYAIKLVARKLQELKSNGYEPTDLLNTAIEKNWITVFEPKEWNGNNGNNKSNRRDNLAKETKELLESVGAGGIN